MRKNGLVVTQGILLGLSLGAFVALGGCSDDTKPGPTTTSDAATPPRDGASSDSGGDDAPVDSGSSEWRSVVGAKGFFAQTFDDRTWEGRTLAPGDLYSVACYGNLIGWASGAAGFVAHSDDGGKTWANQDSHLSANLRAIRFGSTTLGVVAGEAGALAVTVNGGAEWKPVTPLTDVILRGAAVDGGRGLMIVVGDSGVVLRSENSGANWSKQTIAGAAHLRGVAADDGAHLVLAVDSAGTIWGSTDGARSFLRETVARAALNAVSVRHFGGRALAVGAGGIGLVRDANGVWGEIDTGTKVDLNAALIPHHGTRDYVAGKAGTLLQTNDQGAHWAAMPLSTDAELFALEDL